jgi:hypothetical protein
MLRAATLASWPNYRLTIPDLKPCKNLAADCFGLMKIKSQISALLSQEVALMVGAGSALFKAGISLLRGSKLSLFSRQN